MYRHHTHLIFSAFDITIGKQCHMSQIMLQCGFFSARGFVFINRLLQFCQIVQSLLVPLLTGAAAYGAGIAALWRHRRTMLGILSLLQGALLTFAGANSDTLSRFLFLGIFGLVLGLAALIYRPREDRTPFYPEADALLKRQESLQSPEHWQVSFTPSSLLLLSTGPEQEPERQEIPLSSLSWILETADLLAPIFENSILLLQKKDLLSGSLEELRTLLTERSVFVRAETN